MVYLSVLGMFMQMHMRARFSQKNSGCSDLKDQVSALVLDL